MKKFEGQIAAVTGGGGYIGTEICRQFAELGAKVAVIDIRREAADKTVEIIRQNGGRNLD